MVFETYVAGPLETSRERTQMDEVIRALNAAFGPRDEVVRLIVDIRRNVQNGVVRQIDGLLITKGRLFILEIKGVWCNQLTVQYDPELRELAYGSGEGRHRPPLQPSWLIDGVPWKDQRENPLDQIRDQRSKLIWLILGKVRNVARKEKGSESVRTKEEEPAYRLGNAISGFIVFGKGRIAYGTEEAQHYVKSQPWLEIVPMDALIDRILPKTVGSPDSTSLISDQEFLELIKIVRAERRPFHRWLGKALQHEYTEISRVPSLDFLFESENTNNLVKAIDAAHQFRLRAYATDIADVYYRVQDERVQAKALGVLTDWDYPSLGNLMVHALQRAEPTVLPLTAIGILREENNYPETLPSLERALRNSYESDRNYGMALGVVKAVGNLRSLEAGGVINRLFLKLTEGDFYSGLEERAHADDAERARFELQLIASTLENLAACRSTESAGRVRRLLMAFPVDRYVTLIRTIRSGGSRGGFLANLKIQSALGTALRDLTACIGDVWDGQGESEIVAQIEDVFQRILREEDDALEYLAVYSPYLRAITGIRSSEGLSMLIRHLESLPPVTAESKLGFHPVRDAIIEAIADMHVQEGFDFLAEKLQVYKREPRLYDQQILAIVDSLGRSGDPRYVGALSEVLELTAPDSDPDMSVEGIRRYAARALAELGGRQAFEALMQVFMKEPDLAFEPVRRMLHNSSPTVRNDLANHAESLLLPRCKAMTHLLDSHEARVLAEVASEESLEFLFELAQKPEWYHDPLPQCIGSFTHIDWVQDRLLEMLRSTEERQRAFAIEVISGTGCLGDRTDEVLSELEADTSTLVRCSLINHHAYAKKDGAAVAQHFGDEEAEVRAHAAESVLAIPHRGSQRCLVVTSAGDRQVHRVLYTDQGVFFLGTAGEGRPPAEAPEERVIPRPFFVPADRIAMAFVHGDRVKLAGIGKASVHGVYLEETGNSGMHLLVLPLRYDRDELELGDWDRADLWLKEMVSKLHGRREKDEAGVREAEELMHVIDEKFWSTSR